MDEYLHTEPRSNLTPEATAIEQLFWILPKIGPKVRFRLNPSQKAYDQIRSKRDIISKARQKGFSSLGIAYQTVDCLGKEGTRAVLISHEAKSTMRLLDRAHFYLKYMSVEYKYNDLTAKADLGRHSRNEFYFPKTDSSFYIGTAGAKAFGRGDTVTHLHISEYAWWENDALRQVAGLFQAVPLEGTIRIESTGNGKNNDFFYMAKNAEALGYQLFFRSWWQDPEYRLEPKDGWEPVGFEDYFETMQDAYQLDEYQLYWYWRKLLEFRLDLPLMQQEYPSCVDECFRATGGAVFPECRKAPNQFWTWGHKHGYRMDYDTRHPQPEYTYVLGGDASGGTGNDDASIEIICMDTLEEVLSFANSGVDPVAFGKLVSEVGESYNEAYLVVEGNHHGIATHAILTKLYNRFKIYKSYISTQGKHKYGFQTSEATKAVLVGAVLEVMGLGLIIYNDQTIEEINSFEEDPKTGKMGGDPDNRVIALGLSLVGYLKWAYLVGPPKQERLSREVEKQQVLDQLNQTNMMTFTFDEVMKNLSDRRQPKGLPTFKLKGVYDA